VQAIEWRRVSGKLGRDRREAAAGPDRRLGARANRTWFVKAVDPVPENRCQEKSVSDTEYERKKIGV
jgi:hypothetical protein